MKNVLLLAIGWLPLVALGQQSADSIFVAQGADNRWHARYSIRTERTIFDVAKKFGIPAATLADANGVSYTDRLRYGAVVKVPLSPYNWYNNTPPSGTTTQRLYYRATEEWDAKDLAAELRISKRQLQEWNGGRSGDVERDEVVAVGWIGLGVPGLNDVGPDKRVQDAPPPPPPVKYPSDTLMIETEVPKPAPVLSAMEQMFQDQTAGGMMVTTEKGPAAFFPGSGGSGRGVHYAFHNAAPRGSVLRVHNVGTGRTVYAKVLGPLPGTKQYAGAVVGISAAAKAELGVRGDTRAWCEVSYAGY